jgi:alkyl sulfatase BDS1-like metallo-beta-lactamase superfamily hydrolase
VSANQAAAAFSFDDAGDFARAMRGLVATHPTGVIPGRHNDVWNVHEYDFNRGDVPAPDTVNPSLWRQGRLNAIHGLFEVTDGVWQARGYDIANITFIAGDTGWLLVDVLTTPEQAAECLKLANQTLGERPVKAVIFTHSHNDHFGGITGVTTQEAVDAGEVQIIAPEGFLQETVTESIIAGVAMRRRSAFMYGPLLDIGPRGHVDSGLGKGGARGASGLMAPTTSISATGEELVVDGIRIVFQSTPGTEAPAEMNFFFPDLGLLCMAENCTHTLHNVLTLRGAQIRDSLAWSKYVDEAIELFGDRTDILISTHHWPRWDRDDVIAFLETQRDVYRWLHDQTMRLANSGLTPLEIADELELPDCFRVHSHVREYYGTVSHNSRAVYQRYLGWFDGNPANLNPLPPAAAGRRYVAAMGGADRVVELARAAFDDGDYRWVCQLLNHLVFAQPDHQAARTLQADTFEQLGYQSESGPWRDFYLTGALELREGLPSSSGTNRAMTGALTPTHIFDAIAIRLDAGRVGGATVTLNIELTDLGETHTVGLKNCALHHRIGASGAADAVLSMSRETLGSLLTGRVTLRSAVADGTIGVDGDHQAPNTIFDAMVQFDGSFSIAEP